jgi:hypothetical protein
VRQHRLDDRARDLGAALLAYGDGQGVAQRSLPVEPARRSIARQHLAVAFESAVELTRRREQLRAFERTRGADVPDVASDLRLRLRQMARFCARTPSCVTDIG